MRMLVFTALFPLLASCMTISPITPELSQGHVWTDKVNLAGYDERQRLGIFIESPTAPKFKGCVLYLEGFADSILNHYPLFNALNNAGYRVVAFDYLGQGQSDGEMSDTRINAYGDPYPKKLDFEIGQQAKRAWAKAEEFNDPIFKRSCSGSRKTVIGWSTGGLAAYKLAYEKWAEAFVLIAPGIVPNLCVGEAAKGTLPRCVEENLTMDQIITQSSLTSAEYPEGTDPHLDPIEPKTPMKAKEFIINLISTAFLQAQYWHIRPQIKGVVFLSGSEDSYIDSSATRDILRRNAPSFTVISYEGARHEIDNEVPEISTAMHKRTIEFLDSL